MDHHPAQVGPGIHQKVNKSGLSGVKFKCFVDLHFDLAKVIVLCTGQDFSTSLWRWVQYAIGGVLNGAKENASGISVSRQY